MTKRRKLSVKWNAKLFKESEKEIKNSSAGYQTKEIICSMDCQKNFNSILILKRAKQSLNCSADYQTKEIIRSTDCKIF